MGIDWLPTIVEFTHSQSPKNKIDGASLVPLLQVKQISHLIKFLFLL